MSYMPDYSLPADVKADIEAHRSFSRAELEATRKRIAEERKRHEAEQAKEAKEREQRAKELAQKILADQQEAEQVAKAQARKQYPFSDEAFERDWPGIRSQLAAKLMGGREERAAKPTDYIHGLGGGHGTSLKPHTPPSQAL